MQPTQPPSQPYRVIDASDWEHAKSLLTSLGRYWIFRGQRKSTWDLDTSLDREIRDPLNKLRTRYTSIKPFSKNTEDELIIEFRNSISPYLTLSEMPGNTLAWLALMQHYGAPTRLLDFSFSPYKAAFFAFRGDREGDTCAVWALHSLEFAVSGIRRLYPNDVDVPPRFPKLLSGLQDPPSMPNLGEDLYFDNIIMQKQWQAIVPVWSHGVDVRMREQAGMFVIPCDINVPVSDNLSAMGNAFLQSNLIKITIPNAYFLEAAADLEHMGITEETMFPGLDGAIKHFNNRQMMQLVDPRGARQRKQNRAANLGMPTH